MTFNPIEEKRNAPYTYQELKTFWNGPGRIVQRTKEENPVLYRQLQDLGVAAGVIGKSMSPNPLPYVKNYAPAPKQYSTNELRLKGIYSEARCNELFPISGGSSKEAAALYDSDRESYEDAKDAAISYGRLPARTTPRPPAPPAPVKEYLHRVSDELADESHIARGTELPWAQVEQLCSQKVDRERQAQADADAKADAARQAELATLSARQQAELEQRDQKQRDLDRIVELVMPKPTPTPEPIALATARLLAAEKAKAA